MTIRWQLDGCMTTTMIKHLHNAARLCAVAGVLICGTAVATDLDGLRVWTDPDKTRAVLDLDGDVDYRLFTLENPNRVVIDIDDTALDKPLVYPRKHAGIITGVRHGKKADGSLRVVLDLADKVNPKSFVLEPTEEYSHRLVVDLFPQSDGNAGEVVKSAADFAQESERDVVIAIDAGHGGEDPGAIGAAKTREKDVVLAISRVLADVINDEPGMRAVLIRDGDYYIEHRQRYEKARQQRADLFLSIHADAFRDRRVRGSGVFVLSKRGASSEAARRLAAKENRSDLVGGVKLDDKDDMLASVLLDLSQSASLEASKHVAAAILSELKSVGRVHKKHVESANFLVLKSPDVPSVLVETAFISNPDEERRLKDPVYQRQLAKAIRSGVRRHFYTMPPPGTWIAANRGPKQHRVARGDTLGEIAQRYRVSVRNIREANNISGDRITVGTELVIPTS